MYNQELNISIHTPLAGSDTAEPDDTTDNAISIHTPLAGSDYCDMMPNALPIYFNPHSPRGE